MPKALRLPLEDWPAADRAAWERSTTRADYFDERAPAARWSEKSRYQAQAAYGRWLAFLRRAFPEALTLPPETRLDRMRGAAYLDALSARIAPMSIAAELGHLILMMSALAPHADCGWLRQWQYRIQKQACTRDKRGRMVHPALLVELGLALMDDAAMHVLSLEQARQYRDGLLIALLAYRPLRRRSLAALTVGTHVCRIGVGYLLAVPGVDTKSGKPLEFSVPDRLVPYLTRYLEHIRPHFPNAAGTRALWLSTKGGALGADAIYAAICRRTQAAFGHPVHPHLFRDIAVTTFARETPNALHLSADLLSHANMETTRRYYSQAKTIDAARRHAQVLDALRTAPGRVPDRAGEATVSPDRGYDIGAAI